jgi:catechol 2,3-dioxygenase-like lactoylglutathione lyase family enzyme
MCRNVANIRLQNPAKTACRRKREAALRLRQDASSRAPEYHRRRIFVRGVRRMPVSHIEHYLIAADDMDSTSEWYRSVLGMEEGWHPDFGFPVCWLYLGGCDVVHITQSAKHASQNQKIYLGGTAQNTGSGTGAIDHIAFRATGLAETMAHLRSSGIAFDERRANGQAVYQLFMFDPNGIKVELNFDAAEAEDMEPDITGEKLGAR